MLAAKVEYSQAIVASVDDETHVTLVSEQDQSKLWEGVEVTQAFASLCRTEDRSVTCVTAPVVAEWEYEHFTMGHDTGKAYNMSVGVVSLVTAVVEHSAGVG